MSDSFRSWTVRFSIWLRLFFSPSTCFLVSSKFDSENSANLRLIFWVSSWTISSCSSKLKFSSLSCLIRLFLLSFSDFLSSKEFRNRVFSFIRALHVFSLAENAWAFFRNDFSKTKRVFSRISRTLSLEFIWLGCLKTSSGNLNWKLVIVWEIWSAKKWLFCWQVSISVLSDWISASFFCNNCVSFCLFIFWDSILFSWVSILDCSSESFNLAISSWRIAMVVLQAEMAFSPICLSWFR